MLPPEALLACVACAVGRPCESPLSVLLLTMKDKEPSLAVVLLTADSHLRMKDKESFCDNLSPYTSIEETQ